MDDRSKGDDLLALLDPVRVDGVTDEIVKHIIGQLDQAFRSAMPMVRDAEQGLCLMVGVLSVAASMVGGPAAAMLGLPETVDGLREGKVAALDCVRTLAMGERCLH